MNSMYPRVSIGMPIYNGERYLSEAIESLLAQTYACFELVISDNASSDGTEEICLKYAKQDRRIRYIRNNVNIGGFRNHNRVFELSNGEYFQWASDDDVWHQDHLRRCVEVLDNNPQVVLCYARTKSIDENGKELGRPEQQLKVNGFQAHERFRELIEYQHLMEAILGVIRAKILSGTTLLGQYADSDRVLLSELGLYGPFFQIPETLFWKREHQGQSTVRYLSRQERTVWFDPEGATRVVFPHFREFREFIAAVHRIPIGVRQRIWCYRHLFEWLLEHRHRFLEDVDYAARQVLRPYVQKWFIGRRVS